MSRKAVLGAGRETYCGPLDESSADAPPAAIPATELPSRQVWFGRDGDGSLFMYASHPQWVHDAFEPGHPGQVAVAVPEEWFPHLEAGYCQAFVIHGPRVDAKREAT